jgi:hypothetical protein
MITQDEIANRQAEIAALREAIAAGALRVMFRNGTTIKEVNYASIDDLWKRYNILTGLLNSDIGGRYPRVGLATFTRG